MTEQEARKNLEACERQIVDAYNDLKNAAREVGSSAVQAAQNEWQSIDAAASRKRRKSMLLVLSIALILGIPMLLKSHFWGVVIIIGGIVLAGFNYLTSVGQYVDEEFKIKLVANTAREQQSTLNSELDKYSHI